MNPLGIENVGAWPFLCRGMLLSGAFGMVIFLGYYWDIRYRLESQNALVLQHSQLLKQVSDLKQKISHLDAYEKEVVAVKEALRQLSTQLPSTQEEAELLHEISEKAASHTVQFVSIKPGEPLHQKFYTEKSMELCLSGEYPGLAGFVNTLSNTLRIMTVENMDLQINPSVGTGSLLMLLHLKTYWLTRSEQSL